jgi:hypothetical protein
MLDFESNKVVLKNVIKKRIAIILLNTFFVNKSNITKIRLGIKKIKYLGTAISLLNKL